MIMTIKQKKYKWKSFEISFWPEIHLVKKNTSKLKMHNNTGIFQNTGGKFDWILSLSPATNILTTWSKLLLCNLAVDLFLRSLCKWDLDIRRLREAYVNKEW